MANLFYHKELTEAQWNKIKFVFEEKPKDGWTSLNPRIVFNAILWLLKTRWRDLPARYGNWNSIYHKERRWCRNVIKWYRYISQVVRMFDKDLHKEYVFLSYLLRLIPPEKTQTIDLEEKLQLE